MSPDLIFVVLIDYEDEHSRFQGGLKLLVHRARSGCREFAQCGLKTRTSGRVDLPQGTMIAGKAARALHMRCERFADTLRLDGLQRLAAGISLAITFAITLALTPATAAPAP